MKVKIFLFIILVAGFMTSCNDDDTVDYTNNPPEVTLQTASITASAGDDVTIKAKLVDDLGIKYVDLFNSAFVLDVREGVSSPDGIIDNTDFSYDFTIPEDVAAGEYEISMSVKNLTGQITEMVVKVIVE